MSSGAPWSVKGIDPRAREVAKELAARAGMTLGEWLNRSILEGEAPTPAAGPVAGPVTGADRRVPSAPAPDTRDPFDRPEGELRRLSQVLDRLADRLDGAEARTGEALASLDRSVRATFSRLEQSVVRPPAAPRPEPRADRYEEVLRALESALGRLSVQMREGEVRTQETLETFRSRLERAETRPPASAGVDQVAIRIGEIQDRTAAAMSALHEAFGGLDQRLAKLEAGAGEGVESRLREMSFRLGERLDAAREEMARDLSETAGHRIGELERSVAELSEKVRRVERQSAGLRDAGPDRSVQPTETPASMERHPAEEAERISEILASRLSRADPSQAASVARLGEEIARINDRMGLRTDGPLTHAIVAGTGDTADGDEITQRIRRSEDRTARLLEEARLRLDAHFPRPESSPAAGRPSPMTAEESRLLSLFDDDDTEAVPSEPSAGAAVFPGDAADGRGDEWPIDLLAAARAATARGAGDPARASEPEEAVLPGFDLSPPRPALRPRRFAGPGLASLAVFCISVSLVGYGVLSVLDSRTAQKGGARTEPDVLASVPRSPSEAVRAAVALAPTPGVTPAATAQAQMQAPNQAPNLAPLQAKAPVRPSPAAPASGLDARFRKAEADLKAGRPDALSQVRTLAESGHGPSMALMSELYRKGEAGLARDPGLSRSWLRRAAESGDRVSMHLYALALMNGQDGPRDPEVGVSWFRRAAEAGLVGSQFNLGVVYERGMGVPRDLRQAYVWYSRAAENGDGEALRSVERLRPTMTAAAPVSSEDIRLAQTALGRLGYYSGPADGSTTPQLRAAIEAYQKDQKAPATGILDDATLKRLAMLGR
jgi:localization factor PodJL